MERQNFALLIDLTKRDFKVRYLGSLLGSYWNVIHPVMMIFIYTVIFSQVMRAKLGTDIGGKFGYSLYLCSGLLAWNFFMELVTRGTTALLENATFLKKMPFPPVILFGASSLSAGINFLITFGIFSVVLTLLKPVGIGSLLLYFAIVILFALFGFGLAVSLGCLNVFLRDFQQITTIIFQLWFWFTPIVYLYDMLPDVAKTMLLANPAFPFMRSFHKLLFYEQMPEMMDWGLMLLWVGLALMAAYWIYRRSISLVRDLL